MVREPRSGSIVRVGRSGEGRRAGEAAEQVLEPATCRGAGRFAELGGSGQAPGGSLGKKLGLMVLGSCLEVEFGGHGWFLSVWHSRRWMDLVMSLP
jgi:hypothetical protein